MRIELLYFEGCPSHADLLPELEAVIDRLGLDAPVKQRRVETTEAAERERFLGSPTVRIDGVDVDPGAAERTDFGMKCRIYRWEGQASGTPPMEWIEHSLRSAKD